MDGVMVSKAAVEEQTPLRLVGKRLRRADSPERLTGQVRYTGDLVMPGLLYGRLVRSPHASARIVSVNRSAAEATPGVVAVLTAKDLPVRDIRAAVENRSIVMAFERATYVGQPVAVVLAESEAAAEDGAELVEVDYEPSAPAVDMLQALQPDAPIVRSRGEDDQEELGMHGAAASGSEQEKPQAPNVASHQRYHRGHDQRRRIGADEQRQSMVGLVLQDVDPSLARARNLRQGALVADVVPGSLAEAAGLVPGMVIVEAGGKPIRSAADLKKAIREAKPGSVLLLRVEVQGSKLLYALTVPK